MAPTARTVFEGLPKYRQKARRIASIPFLQSLAIQAYTQALAQTQILDNNQVCLTPE